MGTADRRVNISLTCIRAPNFNVTQPIFWRWESAAGDFCGLLVVADKRLQHESWTFKVLLQAVDQLFPAEQISAASIHSRCVGNVSSSIISIASARIIFSCFSRVRWHNVWLHAKWITLYVYEQFLRDLADTSSVVTFHCGWWYNHRNLIFESETVTVG